MYNKTCEMLHDPTFGDPRDEKVSNFVSSKISGTPLQQKRIGAVIMGGSGVKKIGMKAEMAGYKSVDSVFFK